MRIATDCHLTLLVPGLFGPAPRGAVDAGAMQAVVQGLTLDAIERLLARAACARHVLADGGFEGLLFDAFGHAMPPDGDWPVAACTWYADQGSAPAGWLMRADPVYLRPELTGLTLFDASVLDLSMDEARELCAEIGTGLGGHRLTLVPLAPARWYVALDAPPLIRTTALTRATGADVDPHLPTGKEAAHWHALLNEIQMILSASRVNRAREARGAPPVNSVWFWGSGEPPVAPSVDWVRVWSDAPLLTGLAMLAQVPRAPLPANAGAWLAHPPRPGHELALFPALHAPAGTADFERWREQLAVLTDEWLIPLCRGVMQRRLTSLCIRTDCGWSFTATRGALRRWWRRRRPFAAWMAAHHTG